MHTAYVQLGPDHWCVRVPEVKPLNVSEIPQAVNTIETAFMTEKDLLLRYLYLTPDLDKSLLFKQRQRLAHSFIIANAVRRHAAWTVGGGDGIVELLYRTLSAFNSKEQKARRRIWRQVQSGIRISHRGRGQRDDQSDILAAAPAKQGLGYGSALVMSVTAKADEEGRSVWLLTNLYTWTYYAQFGFTTVAQVSLGEKNPTYKGPPVVVCISTGTRMAPPPEPRRGDLGADIIGPRNPEREKQSPSLVRPPPTDSGTLPSLKWSFADSHTRIEEGGWARQTTVRELPTSTELAAVNMRLDEGAIRELHWHREGEWAYILEGRCRFTILDLEGGAYEADVQKGDLWYAPRGRPHSIQGLGKGGCEFMLIFDDGNFSEDGTFLLSDWLAHTPKDVIAKNFGIEASVLDKLSHKARSSATEKYIFRGQPPSADHPGLPADIPKSAHRFTHSLLAQEPLRTRGGTVRIADTSNFPVSTTVSAAHVTIAPHALRELHWHPNADEWSFFIRGRARVTVFAGSGSARTFDYQAGDVGIVPRSLGHYVENMGEEEVEMLEVFRAPKFEDFSLQQWLKGSPEIMVQEHLNIQDSEEGRKLLEALRESKGKEPVKAPAKL
ncbi:RmlC-like cupin domain-containing protein [Amylocystis lapponica]|nr:RmlC-like cupin domain-containing protein [Amylocystis lapponica]